MRKLVVAVSGGVDSVVLLDSLVHDAEYELIVAHFDHGIRPESRKNADFVAALAAKYDLKFELGRAELGAGASEDQARQARYNFLKTLAARYQAQIATAHHSDDVIESIAINIKRGTGWRGLDVMSDPQIYRPLIGNDKRSNYYYALSQRLEWWEDETNHTDQYLRNRLRKVTSQLSATESYEVLKLWLNQRDIRRRIDMEIADISPDKVTSRYFMTMIDESVAREILRKVCRQKFGFYPLTYQLDRGLMAIKVGRPGSQHQLGGGITLLCDKSCWSIQAG